MLLIILTLLDFFSLICILLLQFSTILPWNMALGSALYLMGKSFMFSLDFPSIIDFLIGIYIILMIFGLKTMLTYLIIFYLGQKVISGIMALHW